MNRDRGPSGPPSDRAPRVAAAGGRLARRGAAVLAALALLAPPAVPAQTVRAAADTAAIPLGGWRDDWWYPEGWIRLGRQRVSVFAGVTLTRFASSASRAGFGAADLSPNIEFYRPEHRGFSPAFDITATTIRSAGASAGFFAPTVGIRYQVTESDRAHRIVPFVGLGVGPYFARTSTAGRATVVGANASVGLEILRSVRVEGRYDAVPLVRGHDLSTVSLGVIVRTPPFVSGRARAKMRDDVPTPGTLVDVGGHRLHLVCAGSGEPTVVFDAGLGDSWVSWDRVLPALAGTTRVCAYDRAGVAWSDPGPLPRTSRQIAGELHMLLARAGVAPPYVLVGHSLGGLNVRMYAADFPAEVAGIVLVDATHEDLTSPARLAALAPDAQALVRFGQGEGRGGRSGRLALVVPDLPIAVASRPAWHRTRAEELRAATESSDQLRSVHRTLAVPLTVITGAQSVARSGAPRALRPRMTALWDSLQTDLARLSPEGRRVIAARSGHYVQRDEPEVVVDAVRQMVERVRTPHP